MLSFALKKTDSVQYQKIVKTYLTKNYDPNVVQRVEPVIIELENLRNQIANFGKSGNAEESMLEPFAVYHRHVLALESRLPLGPKSVNIKFKWYDTFSRNNAVDHSWNLEKVSIMFNIGSVYSQVGSKVNRGTVDGAKKAIHCFKSAAGCYDLIRGLVKDLKRATDFVDLTPGALSLRISISMAQAYVCFYETMNRASTNKSIMAKVAFTICHYYSQAAEQANTRDISRALGTEWVDILNLCNNLYRGIAHYWLSFIDKETAVKATTGFGKVVTRLRYAQKYIQKALSCKRASAHYIGKARDEAAIIDAELKTAETDNMQIYMDTLAPETELRDPDIVSQIKLEPPTIDYASPLSNQENLSLLVPPPVLQMLTEYKELVNNVVGQKSEQTMAQGKMMFDTLARMSLPQKLDALTCDDVGLPEGTWGKIQDVQSKGGVNQVEQMMISLRNFAEHSKKMI